MIRRWDQGWGQKELGIVRDSWDIQTLENKKKNLWDIWVRVKVGGYMDVNGCVNEVCVLKREGMHACIYVCMYVCMYICMYVCMYVRISVWVCWCVLMSGSGIISITVCTFLTRCGDRGMRVEHIYVQACMSTLMCLSVPGVYICIYACKCNFTHMFYSTWRCCLSLSFYCCDETPWPKQLGWKGGYLAHIYNSLFIIKAIRTRTQNRARTWRQELIQRP